MRVKTPAGASAPQTVGRQTFLVKRRIANIAGFAGPMAWVAAAQFCSGRRKATVDET